MLSSFIYLNWVLQRKKVVVRYINIYLFIALTMIVGKIPIYKGFLFMEIQCGKAGIFFLRKKMNTNFIANHEKSIFFSIYIASFYFIFSVDVFNLFIHFFFLAKFFKQTTSIRIFLNG